MTTEAAACEPGSPRATPEKIGRIMESRPPQEPQRRPATNGRKPTNAGGAPTAPPWVWLFLIFVVAMILWLVNPRNETEVVYSWFLDQVEDDNVKSIVIAGTEARGELRNNASYDPPKAPTKRVSSYATYFPS